MILNAQFCRRPAIVAIPARDEAARIECCLSALASQRDQFGAPVPRDSFEILIFANNCLDRTADIARAFSRLMPQTVEVIEENLPADELNAGCARRRAMDLAASSLTDQIAIEGVILTTDADTVVGTTWYAGNMSEIHQGADCVAGYIDANPLEILSLGPAFLSRGRLEDTYLRLIAEIYARCDPRLHDPWPNHRVSSGASLAITLSAYLSIGGLPPRPLGEDVALTQTLDQAGFKVRHSMEVCVSTSCRLDGRAQGGAADTMLHRHQFPDAPCDDDLEPALQATRRAIYRGQLRKLWEKHQAIQFLPRRLRLSEVFTNRLVSQNIAFQDAWSEICRESPTLKRGKPLRPSDLPRQIAIGHMVLRQLRMATRQNKGAPGDIHHCIGSFEPAV